ncbi:MAG: IS66-like element accessory protein TnpA, partial [Bradyrhizobium sp.]
LMDGDRRSSQVERLEVVDTGRRRRWSEDEKLKIVLESLQAPPGRGDGTEIWRFALVAAPRRRSFRPEPKDATAQQIGFIPVRVVPKVEVAPNADLAECHRV